MLCHRVFGGMLASVLLTGIGTAGAARRHRSVEIRWDFRIDPPAQLEVWVNCEHSTANDLYTCTNAGATKVAAPASYTFRIEPSDQVALVVISAKTDDPGSATYAITGTDLSEKDLDALKKMFGAEATGKAAGGNVTLSGTKLPEPKADVKAVTDALIPGGKLTATLTLKKITAGKEDITKTSGPLTFLITSETPRMTASFGLGFSNAPNPSVVIAKTSTIVTFQKDGKTQQAYQQVIELQDADAGVKPIQSLVSFANFRLIGPLYASLGLQVNQKLFESPILGGTYRIPLGPRRGLNVTLGVHFSKETEIDPATGFAAGQIIDPTLGLTVADVHTRPVWHRRVGLGFTVDF